MASLFIILDGIAEKVIRFCNTRAYAIACHPRHRNSKMCHGISIREREIVVSPRARGEKKKALFIVRSARCNLF